LGEAKYSRTSFYETGIAKAYNIVAKELMFQAMDAFGPHLVSST
jgi:hypothetical protein